MAAKNPYNRFLEQRRRKRAVMEFIQKQTSNEKDKANNKSIKAEKQI